MMCCMHGLLNPQEELGCSRTMKRSGRIESNTCMANALDSQTGAKCGCPTQRTTQSKTLQNNYVLLWSSNIYLRTVGCASNTEFHLQEFN